MSNFIRACWIAVHSSVVLWRGWAAQMHVSGFPSRGRLVRLAFIRVALTLGVCPALAVGQNLPPWSTKVQVKVAGQDDIRNRVSSWFTEEVRRMQGVEVVDSAAEWEIKLIVMETKNQGGTVTGYALSEVVLSRLDERVLFGNMAAADTVRSHRDVWGQVIDMAFDVRGYEDHQLAVGPMDHLRTTIEGLAAAFDTKQLEPSRKAWERLKHS